MWWLSVQTGKKLIRVSPGFAAQNQYTAKICNSVLCRAWILMFDEEDVPLAAAACVVIAEIVYWNLLNSFWNNSGTNIQLQQFHKTDESSSWTNTITCTQRMLKTWRWYEATGVFLQFTDGSREQLGKTYDIAWHLLALHHIVHTVHRQYLPKTKPREETLDRRNRLELYIVTTGRLLSTFRRSVLAPFKVRKLQILGRRSLNAILNCFISLIMNLNFWAKDALSFLLRWPKTFVRNLLECAILGLKVIFFPQRAIKTNRRNGGIAPSDSSLGIRIINLNSPKTALIPSSVGGWAGNRCGLNLG
jgi:hypothetical protein